MEKAVRFTSNAWKFYNDQSVAVKKELDWVCEEDAEGSGGGNQ